MEKKRKQSADPNWMSCYTRKLLTYTCPIQWYNSLVYRKVLSAIILDDFHVFLFFVFLSLPIDFTSIFGCMTIEISISMDDILNNSFELSVNTKNSLVG